MDEETDEIKQHIDTERQRLGRDLDEIEYRVKKATDFKTHFNKNTGWILGAAVAGGFLVGLASRRSPGSTSRPAWKPDSSEANHANHTNHTTTPFAKKSRLNGISETIDGILDGLIGVASHKLRSIVSEVVPEFREHYDVVENQRGGSSVHQMKPKHANDSDVASR